jgi:uncharacterized protein
MKSIIRANSSMKFPIEPALVVERLFLRVRGQFQLGIGELKAALDVIQGGWNCEDTQVLAQILRLLWCHSLDDRRSFDVSWEDLMREVQPQKLPSSAINETDVQQMSNLEPVSPEVVVEPQKWLSATQDDTPTQNWGIELVQAPPPLVGSEEEIWHDLPVNRRSLAYGWRVLRRFKADGVLDVVDVMATVEQTARQGFYVAPVLQRRLVNQARLLLLIDREGSMVPFHRFSQEVVQTAQEDYDVAAIKVAYFHNILYEYVYEDEHMTQPIELEHLLEWCNQETIVLIVSDGGAARRNRRLERITAVTKFLANLRAHTSLISWLNPVPQERWEGTSAEILAYAVPMVAMTNDGFQQAINLVRG